MASTSFAKNVIRRALAEIAGVAFPDKLKAECRKHFKSTCAYCGYEVPGNSREGHIDHTEPVATSAAETHIVFACQTCNGNERRDAPWEDFLRQKCKGDEELFNIRKQAILDWFAMHPPARLNPRQMEALNEAKRLACDGFDAAVKFLKDKLKPA